jgi:hypothetical protein
MAAIQIDAGNCSSDAGEVDDLSTSVKLAAHRLGLLAQDIEDLLVLSGCTGQQEPCIR